MAMRADFVIIGSGSAGSAMAYRLSESGEHSVLVLEFGGTDAGPLIQMPGALSFPMNMPRYDWGYKSEPEPHLGGRQLVTPGVKSSAAVAASMAWSMFAGTRATMTTGRHGR